MFGPWTIDHGPWTMDHRPSTIGVELRQKGKLESLIERVGVGKFEGSYGCYRRREGSRQMIRELPEDEVTCATERY